MDPHIDRASRRVTEPQPSDFAAMARRMAGRADLEDTIDCVVSEGRRLALGDALGVMLVQGRALLPAAASDPDASRADELQVQCDEGPSLESHACGRTSSADLRRDARWSGWSPQAVQLGWGSVVSLPLVDSRPIGVLNVYLRGPGGPSGPDTSVVQVAEVFAAHAALALAVARERESLTRAIFGRNLIGQAQGILMERHRLQAEQAFDVLRRCSSHGNRKLRQVAEDVVQHRRLPKSPPGRNDRP